MRDMAAKPPQATGNVDLKTHYGKAVKPRARKATDYYQLQERQPERVAQKLWEKLWEERGRIDEFIEPPQLPDSVEKLILAAARPNVSNAERTRMLREAFTVASMSLPEAEYKHVVTAVRRLFKGLWSEPDETKAKFPLESTTPEGASVETPGISGGIDEGLLNEALSSVLTSWGVPKSLHREMAAEMERMARARANVARRPKWDERGKYAELKDLSAPKFLKQVYADVIASDGSINKKTVRDIDPKLMGIVEVYINSRKSRKQGLGDAEGLRLIAGHSTARRKANLG